MSVTSLMCVLIFTFYLAISFAANRPTRKDAKARTVEGAIVTKYTPFASSHNPESTSAYTRSASKTTPSTAGSNLYRMNMIVLFCGRIFLHPPTLSC